MAPRHSARNEYVYKEILGCSAEEFERYRRTRSWPRTTWTRLDSPTDRTAGSIGLEPAVARQQCSEYRAAAIQDLAYEPDRGDL